MTKTLEITTRQSEIIDAAGKILTTSGVSGLTIKNLAKEMQFSESAIYRHFESKEDIILAMLEFLAKNMDERLTNCLALETEFRAQIQSHLQRSVQILQQKSKLRCSSILRWLCLNQAKK
jgi:AcrR family transcriptional regulator